MPRRTESARGTARNQADEGGNRRAPDVYRFRWEWDDLVRRVFAIVRAPGSDLQASFGAFQIDPRRQERRRQSRQGRTGCGCGCGHGHDRCSLAARESLPAARRFRHGDRRSRDERRRRCGRDQHAAPDTEETEETNHRVSAASGRDATRMEDIVLHRAGGSLALIQAQISSFKPRFSARALNYPFRWRARGDAWRVQAQAAVEVDSLTVLAIVYVLD
jgi:hypothetical protein